MKLDDLKSDEKLLQFYRELVLKSGGKEKLAQLNAGWRRFPAKTRSGTCDG